MLQKVDSNPKISMTFQLLTNQALTLLIKLGKLVDEDFAVVTSQERRKRLWRIYKRAHLRFIRRMNVEWY